MFLMALLYHLLKIKQLELVIHLIYYIFAAEQMFIIILFILANFLLTPIRSGSTNSTGAYNRYMIAFSHGATLSSASNSSGSYTYTSIFTNTIEVASQVYYATQSIDGNIMGDSIVMMDYTINTTRISTTSIDTQITGYFNNKYFGGFYYRCLLIFPSNPFLNQYLIIDQLQFTTNAQQTISLSSLNSTRNNISSIVMIKDMTFSFPNSSLASNSQTFFIEWIGGINGAIFQLQVNIPSYVTSYRIRYLIIIIDFTALDKDYKQYPFKAGILTTSNTWSVKSIPISLDTSYTNYLFGLSSVKLNLRQEPSFHFSLGRQNATAVNISFKGWTKSPSQLSYSYHYAAFQYLSCSNNYPIFDKNDQDCYDNCSTSFYLNQSSLSCQACRYDCLTCYNSTYCHTCNTTYRFLYNHSCIPIDGYYESNTTIPFNCSSTCGSCIDNDTFCTSCPAGNTSVVFMNNSCMACQNITEGCLTCNSTYCFSCKTPYRLVNSTYCNIPCNDTNCGVCSNANTTLCYVCNSVSFKLNLMGICAATCGDGIVQNTEVCDDGNNALHDGCDNRCQFEPDYICYIAIRPVTGNNFTQYCAYTQPIYFSVVSIEKVDYSNKIAITISVNKYKQTFWRTQSILNYCLIQTPIPYRNMQISFISPNDIEHSKLASPVTSGYPQGSLMRVTFEYLKSIHGQNISLSFNFNSTTDLALIQIPSFAVSMKVVPQNNLAAHLYTQSTYQNQKMLADFFKFLAIADILLLLASFVLGGKRIIVQMVVIAQITFISLITVPLNTPMHSAITSLAIANNGYNILAGSTLRPVEDTLSDPKVKGMLLYSQFVYNINVGLLLIVLPLLFGFAAFIISKIKDHSEMSLRKIEKVYRYAIGEYTYVGLIFCSCIVAGSSVIEIKFGMKEIESTIGLFSLVLSGCILGFYPIYLFIRVKLNRCFDEYRTIINDDSASLLFQLCYFLLGLIFGAILCVLCNFMYVNCIVAGIAVFLYTLTLCKSFFKKQFDHYRTQINLLTMALVQIPFAYANFNTSLEYSSESDLSIMMPLLLGVLLMINFLANLSCFVYLIYKKYKEKKLQQQKLKANQQVKEESVNNGQFEQLYKNSLISPLTYLKKPKFIHTFIETSEKDQAEDKDPEEIELKEIKKYHHQTPITHNSQHLPEKIIIMDDEYIQNKFTAIDQL